MPRHKQPVAQSAFSTAYRLRDKEKDPVIDAVHSVVDKAGMKLGDISRKGGPALSTMKNWFDGDTLKPQFATLSATIRTVGYEFQIVPSKIRINGHGARATKPTIVFRERPHGQGTRIGRRAALRGQLSGVPTD